MSTTRATRTSHLSKDNAERNYHINREASLKMVTELQEKLMNNKNKKNINWADAGDMGRIRTQLESIINIK